MTAFVSGLLGVWDTPSPNVHLPPEVKMRATGTWAMTVPERGARYTD